MNPFITTVSGRRLNPLDLHPDDIDITDMAHSLANINRFVGHARRPINVAQHSVYVARVARGMFIQPATYVLGPGGSQWRLDAVEMQALLHDGAEYVLGDVSKWVKHSPAMEPYREREDEALRVILEKHGLPTTLHPAVDEADRLMVRFELVQAFGPEFKFDFHPDYTKCTEDELELVGNWAPWTWRASREAFLNPYWNLHRRLWPSRCTPLQHVFPAKTPQFGDPCNCQQTRYGVLPTSRRPAARRAVAGVGQGKGRG